MCRVEKFVFAKSRFICQFAILQTMKKITCYQKNYIRSPGYESAKKGNIAHDCCQKKYMFPKKFTSFMIVAGKASTNYHEKAEKFSKCKPVLT
jgi:hypothetical protein